MTDQTSRTSGALYKLKGDLMATIKSALLSWMSWDHYPLELIVCLTCPIHPGIEWGIRRLELNHLRRQILRIDSLDRGGEQNTLAMIHPHAAQGQSLMPVRPIHA